jgi:hypothetical protein
MSKANEAVPLAEYAGISPETHAAAIATARAEGHAEGVAAERTRIGAIVRSEAAEGRHQQAMSFALDTDLGAAQAVKVLGVSPKETTEPTVPSIAERAATEREFGASVTGIVTGRSPEAIKSSWDDVFARTAAKKRA